MYLKYSMHKYSSRMEQTKCTNVEMFPQHVAEKSSPIRFFADFLETACVLIHNLRIYSMFPPTFMCQIKFDHNDCEGTYFSA